MERVSFVEIAEALGVHVRTVQLRSNREKWPFLTDMARGGAVRVFPLRHLPEEIRIKVVRHQVSGGQIMVSPAVAEVVEKARAGRQDRAEQAEVERIRRERQHAAFAQLPAEKQAIAYGRREVLRACDNYLKASAADRKKDGIADFSALYNNGEIKLSAAVRGYVPSTSVSTVLRWQRDFNASGLLGLVNGYHNPKQGSTSLTKEQQDLAIGILIQHPHCKINTIEQGMQARFNGQTPHCSAIRRFVNSWKEHNASLFLYMRNPDEWKNKRMFAFGQADEQIERVNQRWEFDSTPTDVMLADGRHTIIGVIDVYPRRFKMLVSKTSKSAAVAALVRRTILDWGVPETVKTDNGADYVSKHLVGIFEALEIEQFLCPPFTPEAKPHIERAFRTFAHGIVELLPGYVGHSVADRKAIEARRSFADRLMKRTGQTDAAPIEVNMTAEEFQALCDRWCEAIYHQDKHRALDGRSPAEVARAWKGTEKRIHNERALDILLAESPRDSATITKKGIQVERRHYIAEEMAGLEGEKVRVKLDPADFGTVYLFGLDGKFICTAVDPLRLGHDRAEIAARSKALQKQIVRDGSRELKKLAKATAVDTIHNEILEYREGQIKNIVELPRRSEEYTTEALRQATRASEAADRDRRDFDEIDEMIAGVLPTPEASEPTSPPVKKTDKITPLFASQADRYNWIKSRERKVSGLTSEEYDWLGEYYQTRGGRMYLELEGDLRKKYGRRESRAEG